MLNNMEIEIYIDLSIIEEMEKSLKECTFYETGGILLGKFNNDYSKAYITELYKIENTLSQKKLNYIRNTENAQNIINKRWNDSNGIINYIGEWPTHTNISPEPSNVDIYTMNQLYDKVKNQIPIIFLMIIGMNNQLRISSIGGICKCIHIL